MIGPKTLVCLAMLILTGMNSAGASSSSTTSKHGVDTIADVENAMQAAINSKWGNNNKDKRCQFQITNQHLLNVTCQSDHIRFIGVGDWGETTETAGVLAVRDGVIAAAKTGNYDYILAVGDNFYDSGVASTNDTLWKTTWANRFQVGANLTLPWIALLGNHDWYGNADAQIQYGASGNTGAQYWIMPSKYFSVVNKVSCGRFVKLVVSDTMTLALGDDFTWMTQEFNDPNAEFVLAAGHHQIYSAGVRGDNKDAPMVAYHQLIDSTPSVKAYIAGHEHYMQYLRGNGTDHFMIGGGGRQVKLGETYPGTAAEKVYFQAKYGLGLFDIDVVNKKMAVTYMVYNATGALTDEITFTRHY